MEKLSWAQENDITAEKTDEKVCQCRGIVCKGLRCERVLGFSRFVCVCNVAYGSWSQLQGEWKPVKHINLTDKAWDSFHLALHLGG
ncbi:hypothetical protein DPEC_G00266820 [Dallia pectoralis]|uniref:Uncharacterized protein n=1 Tax=Dallia pectoralis TaxID=75939 RepID=A0ACC2FNU4_DALPE|nr:hypothetical protein DPEC_G00266820 [Dallia pectoralis]